MLTKQDKALMQALANFAAEQNPGVEVHVTGLKIADGETDHDPFLPQEAPSNDGATRRHQSGK